MPRNRDNKQRLGEQLRKELIDRLVANGLELREVRGKRLDKLQELAKSLETAMA